jgi:DNA-binding response OmpR family regulator
VDPARILIVDDTPDNVALLTAQLKRAGHDVVSASSGEAGLAAAAQHTPDLILLDVLMPGLDGYEVCRRLKEDPATRPIPVVMLTALREPADRQRGLDAGADDFLSKPADRAELLARVRSLLRMKRLYDEVVRLNGTLEQRVQERTGQLKHAMDDLAAAQQQVVQQERLRALGQMASGIAHDFNNALAPVIGFAELLLTLPDIFQDVAKARHYVELIQTGAQDAAGIVRRLREFYRRRDALDLLEAVGLPDLIDEIISLTQPKWKDQAQAAGKTITIERDYASQSPVAGDEAELREALTNLIFNAVDAIPERGTLTVRTRDDGNHVLLQVSDTGAGMTEEVRRRCLEPFFSTKGAEGTGLGLAMLHGIVQRHNGTIEIDSAPGKGTTFTLRLPSQPAARHREVAAAAPVVAPRHILVVDDEPHVRDLLREYLSLDGHTVELADNGEAGLRAFLRGDFDLVISDIAMPVMNGERLAGAIGEASPQTPVILLTGFGDFMNAAGELPPGASLVLGKPVGIDTLRHALATVAGTTTPATSNAAATTAGSVTASAA